MFSEVAFLKFMKYPFGKQANSVQMSRNDSAQGSLLVSHCRHQGGGLFPEKIQLFLQLGPKFSNFCPDLIGCRPIAPSGISG